MQSSAEETTATTAATATKAIMLMAVVVSSNPYNMSAIQDSLCATLFPHIHAFTFGAQNTFNLTNNDSQWQFSKASRSAPFTQFIHPGIRGAIDVEAVVICAWHRQRSATNEKAKILFIASESGDGN